MWTDLKTKLNYKHIFSRTTRKQQQSTNDSIVHTVRIVMLIKNLKSYFYSRNIHILDTEIWDHTCRWTPLSLMAPGPETWSSFCRNIKKHIRVWSFMTASKCLSCREQRRRSERRLSYCRTTSDSVTTVRPPASCRPSPVPVNQVSLNPLLCFSHLLFSIWKFWWLLYHAMLGNRIPTLFVEDLKFFEIWGCYNIYWNRFSMLYSFQNLFEKMDIVHVKEEYLKKRKCF